MVPHRTRAQRIRGQVLTLIVLLAIPAAGWLGWDAALRSQSHLLVERDQLAQTLAEAQAELEDIAQRYRQLEVDLLVARESAKGSQSMVGDLEQQLFRLQQDLAVYQGSLSPSATVPGLRIQAFELQATEDPSLLRYKVMVSRVGNEADTTQAQLRIEVLGEQNGEATSLPMSDLTPVDDEDGLPLDFRYFQVVPASSREAEMKLPEGFVPRRVRLRAEHQGKILVEETFDWRVSGTEG